MPVEAPFNLLPHTPYPSIWDLMLCVVGGWEEDGTWEGLFSTLPPPTPPRF